jgi:RNA polymerase sigma factor (TIGR02999 family)
MCPDIRLKTSREITDLLQAWEQGNEAVLDTLVPLVMEELRRLARSYMRRERPGHTLQTTALINEAFLKLTGESRVHWQDRAHFYVIAARCMRRVLTDYARSRHRAKHVEGGQQVSFSSANLNAEQSEELLALDVALHKLARKDPRKSKVVELRYFGGYSVEEISQMMDVSEATIARDWRMARAWLRRELGSS